MGAIYSVNVSGTFLIPEISRFPDGTVGVKMDVHRASSSLPATITVLGYEPDTLTIIAAMRSILGSRLVSLVLPYIPNARYDRHMVAGDALMMKVFATQLNALDFQHVYVLDPHSSVSEALLDNLHVIKQADVLKYMLKNRLIVSSHYDYIVAPDMGALKKAKDAAAAFGGLPVVVMDKVRDLATGAITGLAPMNPDVITIDDARFLIVDDLCDGGRTFIETAKALRNISGASVHSVDLYVTHGIFSQGLKKLLDNGINHVYTTDSFVHGLTSDHNVTLATTLLMMPF